MQRIAPTLLAVLVAACTTQAPTATAELPAEAAPKTTENAPLVRVELSLVDAAQRERLAARLGPDSPLAHADTLLAVHHHIDAGWHIYWQNPGESGLRTKLDITAEHARPGPVLYPAPDRFTSEGGQVNYGWGHDAVLFIPLAELGAGASVELTSSYLACAQSCIPGTATIATSLDRLEKLGMSSDAVTTKMLDRVPEPAGDHVAANWSDGKLIVQPRGEFELAELFPFATDTAVLGEQTLEANNLALHYRFTGPPPDGGQAQGVLRSTSAGETRWLELAVPWPTI